MFSGSQGQVVLIPPESKTKDTNQQILDDEAFVLEIEDYLDTNTYSISNIEDTTKTDGISRDISKMSMKGFVDDPFLSLINNEIGSYQPSQHDMLTPLQSSVTSFIGMATSESSSNYWSSSPDTSSGLDETNTPASTYFLLPNSYDSFNLSYEINLSATADQIIVPSSSLQEDQIKSNEIVDTMKGKYQAKSNFSATIFCTYYYFFMTTI